MSEKSEADGIPSLPIWNQQLLIKAVGDKKARLTQLVNMYIDTTPEHVEQLNRALKASDLETIASIAHLIKGSTSTMGGTALANHCGAIEEAAKKGDAEALVPLQASLPNEAEQLIKAMKAYQSSDDSLKPQPNT